MAAVATGADSSREEPELPLAPPRGLWKKTRAPPPPAPPAAASLLPVTTDISSRAGVRVRPRRGAGGAPGAATTVSRATSCEGLARTCSARSAAHARLLGEGGRSGGASEEAGGRAGNAALKTRPQTLWVQSLEVGSGARGGEGPRRGSRLRGRGFVSLDSAIRGVRAAEGPGAGLGGSCAELSRIGDGNCPSPAVPKLTRPVTSRGLWPRLAGQGPTTEGTGKVLLAAVIPPRAECIPPPSAPPRDSKHAFLFRPRRMPHPLWDCEKN